MWKLIYGLTTVKLGEIDPFEGNNDEKEEEKGESRFDKEETRSLLRRNSQAKDPSESS